MEDLGQTAYVDNGQETQDMGQEFVDFGQETEDLRQQTQDFGQETEDLGQQHQDFGQEAEDLGQQHQENSYHEQQHSSSSSSSHHSSSDAKASHSKRDEPEQIVEATVSFQFNVVFRLLNFVFSFFFRKLKKRRIQDSGNGPKISLVK